jgi:AAA+ ATPase superfamily predicted ATPase
MFVNRIKELRILNITAEAILANEQRNMAIIGNRRIGKTELILEFKRKWQKKQGIVFPYLNVQRVGNIDSFIFSYYREFLFEIGKKQGMMIKRIDLVTWDDLLVLSTKLHFERITEKIKGLNGMDALEFLFESQDEILEKTGLVSVFFFDEFQYVERFGTRFLEVMRSVVEKQKMVAYIITGSSISLMEKIFSQSKEPFFAQFRRMYLGPLQKLDAKKLAAAALGQHSLDIDDTSGNEVFRLTNGHPFYLISLCRRIVEQFDTVDVEKIRYAFLEETLSPHGDMYLVLDYIFNESLSRAYKGELHRQILLILAGKQGLTLTEVAHDLGRPSGEVSNYLKLLLKTDLLVREENQYYFRDPLLAFWLKNTYLGIDDAELENATVRNNLLAELTEKYLQVSSELGRAKEYEYKARLEEEFTIPLNRFVSSDGQIEFDLVGEKKGIVYIFEIKWRNRPVSIKEIVHFGNKVRQSDFVSKGKKLFMLSKSGVDAKALALAKKQKIHCLDKDMKEIQK